MDETWEGVASFLSAVESRYRQDRLRIGPDAKRLAPDEEAAVARVVRRACELYLHAGEDERDQMRQFFAATYSLQWRLWSVSGAAAEEAERSGSPDSLRLALGALSLEEGVSDCRDIYLALSKLAQIAAKRGIEWRSIEDEVAALSSPRMRSLLQTGTLNMPDFA